MKELFGAAFFIFFWIIPLGVLLFKGTFVWDETVQSAFTFTLWQSLLSVLGSLGLGAIFGFSGFLNSGVKARLWLRRFWMFPFVTPTLVVAALFLQFFGVGSPWPLAYTGWAVVAVHIWFNAPWIAALTLDALERVETQKIDAAQTLGFSPARSVLKASTASLLQAWRHGALAVFSLCLTSFTLVLLLGGGPPQESLETAVLSSVQSGLGSFDRAITCALLQMILAITAALLFAKGLRPLESERRHPYPWILKNPNHWMRSLILLIAGAWIAPLIWFLDPRPVLALFRSADSLEIAQSLQMSLLLGLGAVGIALAMSWILVRSSYRRVAFVGVTLIQGISLVVLGLGFYLVYGATQSWVLVVLLSFSLMPLFYRILTQVEESSNLSAAAMTLSVRGWHRFRIVEWPLYRSAVLRASLLGLVLCLSELAAVSLFFGTGTRPLSLLVGEWLGQYRFEEARALSGLMLYASLLTFGLLK